MKLSKICGSRQLESNQSAKRGASAHSSHWGDEPEEITAASTSAAADQRERKKRSVSGRVYHRSSRVHEESEVRESVLDITDEGSSSCCCCIPASVSIQGRRKLCYSLSPIFIQTMCTISLS